MLLIVNNLRVGFCLETSHGESYIRFAETGITATDGIDSLEITKCTECHSNVQNIDVSTTSDKPHPTWITVFPLDISP